jgi:hypothetical protein
MPAQTGVSPAVIGALRTHSDPHQGDMTRSRSDPRPIHGQFSSARAAPAPLPSMAAPAQTARAEVAQSGTYLFFAAIHPTGGGDNRGFARPPLRRAVSAEAAAPTGALAQVVPRVPPLPHVALHHVVGQQHGGGVDGDDELELRSIGVQLQQLIARRQGAGGGGRGGGGSGGQGGVAQGRMQQLTEILRERAQFVAGMMQAGAEPAAEQAKKFIQDLVARRLRPCLAGPAFCSSPVGQALGAQFERLLRWDVETNQSLCGRTSRTNALIQRFLEAAMQGVRRDGAPTADAATKLADVCRQLLLGPSEASAAAEVHLPLIQPGYQPKVEPRELGFVAGFCENIMLSAGCRWPVHGVANVHFYINLERKLRPGQSELAMLRQSVGNLAGFLGRRTAFRIGAGVFTMHAGGYRTGSSWHAHIHCDMRAMLHGWQREGRPDLDLEATALLAHAAGLAGPAKLDAVTMRAEPRTLVRLQTRDGRPSRLAHMAKVVLCREQDCYQLAVATTRLQFSWKKTKETGPWYPYWRAHPNSHSPVGLTSAYDLHGVGAAQPWLVREGTGRHKGSWSFESTESRGTFLCPDIRSGGTGLSLCYEGYILAHTETGCQYSAHGELPDACYWRWCFGPGELRGGDCGMLRNLHTNTYLDSPQLPLSPCHPGPVEWHMGRCKHGYFKEDLAACQASCDRLEPGVVAAGDYSTLAWQPLRRDSDRRPGLSEAVRLLGNKGIRLHCHPFLSIVALQADEHLERKPQQQRDALLLQMMVEFANITGIATEMSRDIKNKRKGSLMRGDGVHLVLALHKDGAPGVLGAKATNMSPDGLAVMWPPCVHAYMRIDAAAFPGFHPEPHNWLAAYQRHGDICWPTGKGD